MHETVLSLRVLSDPGRHALLLPWRRSVVDRLAALDVDLLLSLVGDRRALPDYLTPRPAVFAPSVEEELALIRATAPAIVRRDLLAISQAGASPSLPPRLRAAADDSDDAAVEELRDTICDTLAAYWRLAVEPVWPRLRLLLEADMTYRARRLATGGARQLFADMHPNVRWQDGVLSIDKMIGRWHAAAGRPGPAADAVGLRPPARPARERGRTADAVLSVPRRGDALVRAAAGLRRCPGLPARRDPRQTPVTAGGTDAHGRTGPPPPGDAERGVAASPGPVCDESGHPSPRRPTCPIPAQPARRRAVPTKPG